MKTVVVLSGAGISAESGLKTFRGDGGLWEGHRVEDVATPEAWARDPALVLEFYNQRRRQVRSAQPNAAHRALVDLERAYDVHVVTQNVDDLHERAGSSQVLHCGHPSPAQPPMPHCGRPQSPPPPGSPPPFATWPLTTLKSLVSLVLWQCGHSGFSSPRMSSSTFRLHLSQEYSYNGIGLGSLT